MTENTQMQTVCGAIHTQLALIMNEVQAVGKTGRNSGQGYNYRKAEDVVNMLHPIFAKHNVYVTSEVLDERTEDRKTRSGSTLIYRVLRVKVSYVSGEDGSREWVIVSGEGMDSGDKASNKAMTAALKYAVSQTFLLPFDLVDSESTTPEESTPSEKPEPKAEPAAAAAQGAQEKLIEQMAADGISNIAMIRYCQGKGWLQDGDKAAVTDLPDKLIGKMLEPDNWKKVKEKTQAAAKPLDSNKTPVAPVRTSSTAFTAKLYTMMELSGIGRDELKAYLVKKRFITSAQAIDNLPDKFVDKMLEDDNWEKIITAIRDDR